MSIYYNVIYIKVKAMNCEKPIFHGKVSDMYIISKKIFDNQTVVINNYKNSRFVKKIFA